MYRKTPENGSVVYRYKTEGTSLAAYSNQINCIYHTVSSSVTTHEAGLARASKPLLLVKPLLFDVSFPQPVTHDVPHQNTIHACQCCQSHKQSICSFMVFYMKTDRQAGITSSAQICMGQRL
jgi:hypothetical protein